MTTTFTVNREVDIDGIRGLLCSAFEGGSNYWYVITRYQYPKGFEAADFREGGRAQPEEYWHASQLVPFMPGGAVWIRSIDNDEINGAKEWSLDTRTIQAGLETMAKKYPKHWGDFVSDNADADTGDVFLQCCLFGELVYG